MVYGIMKANGIHHPRKLISFGSFKILDVDKFLPDLNSAPWQVADILVTVDDQYSNSNMWLTSERMRVRAKNVLYMSADWKKAIRQKHKYLKKYAKEPTRENWNWRNSGETTQLNLGEKQ